MKCGFGRYYRQKNKNSDKFPEKKPYNLLTVTHVFINDPTRGYGIGIEKMLDAN